LSASSSAWKRAARLAGDATAAAAAVWQVLGGADAVLQALLAACSGERRAAAVEQLRLVAGDEMLKRLLDSFEAYLVHAPQAEGASPGRLAQRV